MVLIASRTHTPLSLGDIDPNPTLQVDIENKPFKWRTLATYLLPPTGLSISPSGFGHPAHQIEKKKKKGRKKEEWNEKELKKKE